MKKVLLTGGSGFIGRNIQESYLRDKYEIIAPRHAELDVADTESVDNYFRNREFDIILHCAVKPGHRNAKDPSNLFYNNIRMFANLERHKDRFGKLINFGSGAVYDTAANNADVTEEQIFQNMGSDDHSFCKYMIAKLIEERKGFIDLNIFGIFGKYEDYSIRFISNAICKALLDLPITLRQNRRFSYLDINDLPPILEFFMDNTPRYHSYNIVPDSPAELKQIAETIREISGKDLAINIANPGYGLDYYGSNLRLKKEFTPIFRPLKQSIIELFNYYNSIKKQLNYQEFLQDK